MTQPQDQPAAMIDLHWCEDCREQLVRHPSPAALAGIVPLRCETCAVIYHTLSRKKVKTLLLCEKLDTGETHQGFPPGHQEFFDQAEPPSGWKKVTKEG